jgi:hypothetical protein
MRKTLATALVLSLVVGALGVPALAAKKKKKKPPAPVAVNLFFHGTETLGEVDAVNNVQAGGSLMPMDTTEPTEAQPKSFPFLDLVATPNESCSGSPLFPSWRGALSGRVTGDVKVVFNTIASAGSVDVELFADVGPLQCNETYIAPVAETTVDLPPGAGTVEAVIKGVDLKVLGVLVVMINPRNLDAPAVGRVLYDSTSDPSGIELMCVPNAGATACTE